MIPDYLTNAINDRPDDDTPRLVAADWLDDHAGAVPCDWCRGTGEDRRPEPIEANGKRYVYTGPNGSCPTCRGSGAVSDGRAERAYHIRVSIRAYREDGENGWVIQPHMHHPQKHLFAIAGLRDSQYTYARGFPEVRLTLAQLVGGECGRCGGDGRAHGADRPFEWSADVDYGKCVVCRGGGRTPGLAAALGRVVGLTAVTLMDREPDEIGERFCWVRLREGLQDNAAVLPDELFRLLAGGEYESAGEEWVGRFGYDDEWTIYPTRDAALRALSAAAIAFCREVAKTAITEPTLAASIALAGGTT